MFKILRGYEPRTETPSDVEMALLANCEPPATEKTSLGSLPLEVRIKIYELAADGADAKRQHQIMRLLPPLALAAPATKPYRDSYAPLASNMIAQGRALANSHVKADVVAAALDYAVAHKFSLWPMLEETKALVPHQEVMTQAVNANAAYREAVSHCTARTWSYATMLGTLPISSAWWMILTPTVPVLRRTFNSHWLSAIANDVVVSIGIAVGAAGAITLGAATMTAVVVGCQKVPVNVDAYRHRSAMRQITRQSQLTQLERTPAVMARYQAVKQRQEATDTQVAAALDNRIAELDERIAQALKGSGT